jgi:diadenylate cyclase
MAPGTFSDLISSLPRLTFTSAVDILIVAVLIYQCVMLIRGRRAARVLIGIGLIVFIYLLSVAANLEVLRTLLETMAPYSAFALIVMFQSEIRRALSALGERRWMAFGSRLENIEVADEILFAISNLAQNKVGALIVIEREVGLRTFVESGVPVDSRVTRDLLLSIFQPGGALHDGAVIVQGGRLAAAACFLPLTMNPELSRKLGTRHRAGIGVTEESDCLAIIVSEERGAISLAQMGELEMDVTIDTVGQRLGRRSKRRSPQMGASAAEAFRK